MALYKSSIIIILLLLLLISLEIYCNVDTMFHFQPNYTRGKEDLLLNYLLLLLEGERRVLLRCIKFSKQN